MKKIIAGILGLALVAGVSTQAARAVFTSQAEVNGINITAGDALLEVSGDNSSWTGNLNAGLNITGIYPGFEDNTTLYVRNNSTSNIDLAVTAQLTAATGWPNLSNEVEVRVSLASDTNQNTGWITLANWNAAPVAFPGSAIGQGLSEEYLVEMMVPNSVGNEIAGLSLTNITFTLTGTQTP